MGGRWWLGLLLLGASLGIPVQAGLKDNSYEGDIFVIYGGNGYIASPRTTLEQSLERGQPVMLLFYVNDSKDCKAYAPAVSRLQVEFEREVNFIALNVDGLPELPKTEAQRYFKGQVPYTVLIDRTGKVLYQASGAKTYNELRPLLKQVAQKTAPPTP
ncbi:thylakoid membrane photosystem I accumulation factor [Anthocerotibacter panamensis]|uniref:thylakoid membrane photosystem I accumulation factor n=1 Tax=Anthocerotibacter panamensis TaxID=2857077 RepID=UPI001C4085F6|nr:thylakoid membrane photosystem I accumulation factor [Anthocerotibacter panamensis]